MQQVRGGCGMKLEVEGWLQKLVGIERWAPQIGGRCEAETPATPSGVEWI